MVVRFEPPNKNHTLKKQFSDELWSVVCQYIVWDATQEYPIVVEYSRKRHRYALPSENWPSAF